MVVVKKRACLTSDGYVRGRDLRDENYDRGDIFNFDEKLLKNLVLRIFKENGFFC